MLNARRTRDVMITERDIAEMHGPALTRAAWELELAPRGIVPCGIGYWVEDGKVPWDPHVTLLQADALLRSLRRLGWAIVTDAQEAYGRCEAIHLSTGVRVITWWASAPGTRSQDVDATESLALTRCAVLAAYKETILRDYETAEG
jgi:hypothetical protein